MCLKVQLQSIRKFIHFIFRSVHLARAATNLNLLSSHTSTDEYRVDEKCSIT
uniref:Uncharacterized protein n=1 Tax=Aegilops tauschii subsp. strangulata TaxID=200361 RepID=A0A453RIM4_AEGTS